MFSICSLAVEQLQPVLVSYVERSLSFADLQAATAAIAQTYRDAGWVVRAYLPAQDISEGIVSIQIIEAVFGGTQLEGPEASRLQLSQIQNLFDAQQKEGDLLNAEALDRALLLADDLPGVAVAGALREGKEKSETELVLKLADEPLLSSCVRHRHRKARV